MPMTPLMEGSLNWEHEKLAPLQSPLGRSFPVGNMASSSYIATSQAVIADGS
jgi:hypothetical protein